MNVHGVLAGDTDRHIFLHETPEDGAAGFASDSGPPAGRGAGLRGGAEIKNEKSSRMTGLLFRGS